MEQNCTELFEAPSDLTAAIYDAVDAWVRMVQRITELIQRLVQQIVEHFGEWIDKILRCFNPKWYHMSKHAKKKRIRKKYRTRLVKELRKCLK